MGYYELWDTGTRNFVEGMETKDEALAFVRELLDTDEYYLLNLSLTHTDDAGKKTAIARADDLARLARARTVSAS